MLKGCLDDVCIHMMPSRLLGDPGSRMRLGWAGGGLSGSGSLGDSSQPSPLCQTLLLEKLRVAKRPANEATFNIFYYLLACSDSALR